MKSIGRTGWLLLGAIVSATLVARIPVAVGSWGLAVSPEWRALA